MENKVEEKSGRMKHGSLVGTRGKIFYGVVVKKFEKRVVVEFERTIRIPKYERFMKKITRLHARIPEGMEVSIGDYVKLRECRPLSKIIHFVVLEIVKKQGGSK